MGDDSVFSVFSSLDDSGWVGFPCFFPERRRFIFQVILAALDSLGIRDNTIIFFASGTLAKVYTQQISKNEPNWKTKLQLTFSAKQTTARVWQDIHGEAVPGFCVVVTIGIENSKLDTKLSLL